VSKAEKGTGSERSEVPVPLFEGLGEEPAVGRLSANRRWVRCDHGLGGLVVTVGLGFRGPGWPNGPPSPRLAPGGFYCVTARGIRVREGWARANRAGVGKPSAARKAKLGFPRASGEQDARSECPARWHGPPRACVRCRRLFGGERGLGFAVVSGWAGFREPGKAQQPAVPPARAGGLLLRQLAQPRNTGSREADVRRRRGRRPPRGRPAGRGSG